MQETNQSVVPPAAPKAAPVVVQSEEAKHLKKISDDINFIRQVVTLALVLSVLAGAAQICAAMGLFPR